MENNVLPFSASGMRGSRCWVEVSPLLVFSKWYLNFSFMWYKLRYSKSSEIIFFFTKLRGISFFPHLSLTLLFLNRLENEVISDKTLFYSSPPPPFNAPLGLLFFRIMERNSISRLSKNNTTCTMNRNQQFYFLSVTIKRTILLLHYV